jgi:hypothetical protein
MPGRQRPRPTRLDGPQSLPFWVPLTLLGAFLCWPLFAPSARLPQDLREGSNDLSIYRQAGEALLRGEIPYRDFFIEYPPAASPSSCRRPS